jgi:hypothetical protein
MPAVYGTCAHCETEDRLLKYARHTMCCKYACQRAAHALVVARKAAAGGGSAKKANEPPTFCYQIWSVHGQRDVDTTLLVGKKRRNKLDEGAYEEWYLVYGLFCEDDSDDGFWDTRWVAVADLMANEDKLGDSGLKPIEEYEKGLAKRMAKKRQQVRVDLAAGAL